LPPFIPHFSLQPSAFSFFLIPLARAPRSGFILSMDSDHKIEKRWRGAGEVILWVVYFFWAVWVFNAFLPPKPEQTPFETYLGKQMKRPSSGRAGAQPWTPEARDLAEQTAAGARD
jgi:hypothetical protein